jgi:hypothetical protein
VRLGFSDRGNTVGKASRDRTKTRESFRETWFEAGRAARGMRLRIGEIRRKILSGGEKVGSKGNLEEAFRPFFQVRRSQATNRGFRIAEAPVWRAGSRPESSPGGQFCWSQGGLQEGIRGLGCVCRGERKGQTFRE